MLLFAVFPARCQPKPEVPAGLGQKKVETLSGPPSKVGQDGLSSLFCVLRHFCIL